MMAEDGEFLRTIVRTVIREFLEAEMSEAIGAQKGRTNRRALRLPEWLLPAQPDNAGGKARMRIPQDRNGRFSTEICEAQN